MLWMKRMRGLTAPLALGAIVLAGGWGIARADDDPEVRAADSPTNPELLEAIHLGDQFLGSQLPGKAAEKFEEALRIDPENAEVHSRLAWAYLQAEDFEKAVKTYRRLAEELKPDDCNSYMSLGFAYMRQELTDQAIVAYEKALTLCPDDPNAFTQMARAYAAAGYETEAIEAYRRGIELNPNDVASYEALASLLYKRKLYPEAIATYEAVLAMPNHGKDEKWVVGASKRLGLMYKWAENCEKAIPYYRTVVEAEPANVNALKSLAVCYEKAGQTADAIRAYDKLIKAESDKPLYYYRLAELLNDIGQYEKALRTIRQGKQYDTDCSAHAYAVAGRALEKTGEYRKAEREFKKCAECGDKNFTSYCTQQIERQQQLAKIQSLKKQKAKQGY